MNETPPQGDPPADPETPRTDSGAGSPHEGDGLSQTPPPSPAPPAPDHPSADDGLAVPPHIEAAAKLAGRIREQVQQAFLGQEAVVEQVLATFMAGGHVLLEGPPGLGKTLLVLALSRTFGGKFARVQFTPDLMPSDVVGHAVLDPQTGEMSLRRGPAFTNLLLADEINRAPAKTQAALLEVMQEQQITIEGESLVLDGPFMTLATQNPLEHEGTYPLPEAQLDRFLLKVRIDYAEDSAEELAVVSSVVRGQSGDRLDVSQVQPVATADDVLELQRATGSLLVDERIMDYALRIVRRTRSWAGFRVGAGTRGAIALVRVARAMAVMEGRSYVLPDDIKRLALPALRHRVILAPEMMVEGQDPDDVLRAVLDEVEVPRS